MIFYFSGSGNSYYAARLMAENLKLSLISMAECLKQGNFEFDSVKNNMYGFVFPVYFWSMPFLVKEFIKQLQLKTNKNTYTFVVFICGGDTGNAANQFKKLLRKSNINLSAVYSIQQIDIFVPVFKIPEKEKCDKSVLKSSIEVENILKHIKTGYSGNMDTNTYKISKPATFLFQPVYNYYRRTSKFRVSDNCTSCKKCENICPLDVIKIVNNKPVWQKKKCTLCLSCLHICPVQAIDYGKVLFFFDSKDKGRYRNPYAEKGY